MPIHNQTFVQLGSPPFQTNPAGLAGAGPVLPVEVHVPAPLAALLTNQNKPVPPPVVGFALIDTGASITGVNDAAAQQLGLPVVGQSHGLTAGGPTTHNIYAVRLAFPGVGPGTGLDVAVVMSVGVNLTGQHVGNATKSPVIVLVGRDILSACVLTYNGAMGMFTLTW